MVFYIMNNLALLKWIQKLWLKISNNHNQTDETCMMFGVLTKKLVSKKVDLKFPSINKTFKNINKYVRKINFDYKQFKK